MMQVQEHHSADHCRRNHPCHQSQSRLCNPTKEGVEGVVVGSSPPITIISTRRKRNGSRNAPVPGVADTNTNARELRNTADDNLTTTMMHPRKRNKKMYTAFPSLATTIATLAATFIVAVTALPMAASFSVERRLSTVRTTPRQQQQWYQRQTLFFTNVAFSFSDPTTARRSFPRPRALWTTAAAAGGNDEQDSIDGENEEEEEELLPPVLLDGFDLDDDDVQLFAREDLASMTVAQLKQQLRLRGKKVTGNKAALVDRLLETSSGTNNDVVVNGDLPPGYSKYEKPSNANGQRQPSGSAEATATATKESDRVKEARARGADIVDVAEFVDADEAGRAFRSSDRVVDAEVIANDKHKNNDKSAKKASATKETSTDTSDSDNDDSSSPEVWGEDARIVEDYEGRSVVVDGLSRTIIEYKGANDTIVQAYVVGSRDSLKAFLRGGDTNATAATTTAATTSNKQYSSMEEEVYAIQKKREMESKKGLLRPDEVEGADDASDPGAKRYDAIERDHGDWGVYTPTGAQLSSSEVQGVLLLSDVYGPFAENARALADKIAFECQPVVVLAPDVFRGHPWTQKTDAGDTDGSPSSGDDDDDDGPEQRNEEGKTYEEWRSSHPDRRVEFDVRASAAVLRERYGVSSVAVWGTCYGGGRALEVASGWYAGGPEEYYDDAMFSENNRRPPPPHVDPVAAVAWYPTRYDARRLFGRENEGFRTFASGRDRSVAVMAVFAGDDALPGATPADAALLRECLEEDPRIKDYMVKVFPDQKHGFAHANLGGEGMMGGNHDGSNNDGLEDRFMGEDYGSMEAIDIGGDAEVACLLSTAWMETYTRVFLPTVGTPVRFDANDRWSALETDGYSQAERRDVRDELEEAIAKFEDADVDLGRMSQSGSPLLEGQGSAAFDRMEDEREAIRRQILEKYDISEEDDEETFDRKFEQARKDGALDGLLIDAYMDDSGDAYW